MQKWRSSTKKTVLGFRARQDHKICPQIGLVSLNTHSLKMGAEGSKGEGGGRKQGEKQGAQKTHDKQKTKGSEVCKQGR